VLVIFAALMGVATYSTGDGAAAIVKHVEGVNTAAIGPHDEAAGLTLGSYIVAAVLALFALIKYRAPKAIARWAATMMIILTLIATASATYTAMLGGRIHHPETAIRAK
jgi:hypothetical protein